MRGTKWRSISAVVGLGQPVLGRDHALGEVVHALEAAPLVDRDVARRPERLEHPLRGRPLPVALAGAAERPRRERALLGDRRQHCLGQVGVLVQDAAPPRVLAAAADVCEVAPLRRPAAGTPRAPSTRTRGPVRRSRLMPSSGSRPSRAASVSRCARSTAVTESIWTQPSRSIAASTSVSDADRARLAKPWRSTAIRRAASGLSRSTGPPSGAGRWRGAVAELLVDARACRRCGTR